MRGSLRGGGQSSRVRRRTNGPPGSVSAELYVGGAHGWSGEVKGTVRKTQTHCASAQDWEGHVSGNGLRVPVSTFSMDATNVCDPASVVYEVSALGGVVHVSISRGAVGRFTIICGDSPRFSTKCDNTGPMFRLEIAPR